MSDNSESLKAFLKSHLKENDHSRLEDDLKKSLFLGKRKAKKKINNKKTKKSKYITRREKKDMGLYHLPRKGMKYEEVLPMYDLWKQYMVHLLELDEQKIPAIEEKTWDSFSQLICKSDFHGALVTVIRSQSPNLVGISGICVIDTKNTFKLLCRDNVVRTIPKQQCEFMFHLGEVEFSIFGKHISKRPAERSVRQTKQFILSDL